MPLSIPSPQRVNRVKSACDRRAWSAFLLVRCVEAHEVVFSVGGKIDKGRANISHAENSACIGGTLREYLELAGTLWLGLCGGPRRVGPARIERSGFRDEHVFLL